MKRLGAIAVAISMIAGVTLSAPANAAKQTLTIWATGGDADAAVMKAAGKAFEDANPGVSVNVQAISWGDGYAKVLAAAAAKKGPDIFTGGLSWGISAGNKGALADLRALGVASYVQPKVPAQIYKALVGYKSTKVYAVPFDLTLMMMFYDKNTLSKAGITAVPKTVAEFNAAAAKLKSAGVTTPVYNEWGNADWLGFFSWLYSMGGSLYDATCKVTINNAKGVAALNQYKKLYEEQGAPKPGVADWSMNDNLKKGTYGIGFSGNFQASSFYTYYKDYKDWNAAPVPAAPGSKSVAFIGGRGISVMGYASKTQQALAAKFIKTLYDRSVVRQMNLVGAAQNAIFLSPVISNADTIDAYPASVLATIKSQLADAQGPPNCNGWEDSQAGVTTALQSFLFGSASAQAALDEAAAVMKSKL
ncbi:UgpB ABC-type sugar transport system, periplasmic component [Candidatus Nanopelagicaceae bacterium]